MDDIREMIKKTIAKMGTNHSPKEMKLQEEVLLKIFEEGKKPYEAMKVSKDIIEYLYSQAFREYNAGKYKEAKNLFFILETFDPQDLRFSYGIAACYHMEKRWDEAIALYCQCLATDPQSSLIYYHLADCYLQQDKKIEAALMLKMCLRYVGNDPTVQPLKERATLMYGKLIDELNARKKNENSPIEANK